MNDLSQSIQQAYDDSGRPAAVQAFIDKAVERDWTEGELKEAVLLLRSLPKEA